MVSAGADFQVKVWNTEGKLLRTSGHHHASVEALAALPSSTGTSMVGTHPPPPPSPPPGKQGAAGWKRHLSQESFLQTLVEA